MSLNQSEIRTSLKIAVWIANGFMLFGLLIGGSQHELTHISDLVRTAQGFLGIVLASLPFCFALRAVTIPGRRRTATAIFANAFLFSLFILLSVGTLVSDFDRGIQVVAILGLVCLPVLFNAVTFGTLWWKNRATADKGAIETETGLPVVPFTDPPPLPTTPLHTNYLVRHWQGNLPLWMAFWLNWAVIAAATTSVLRTLVKEMLYGVYSRVVRHSAYLVLVSGRRLALGSPTALERLRTSMEGTCPGDCRDRLSRNVAATQDKTVPEIVGYAQFLLGEDLIGRPELHISDDRRVLKVHGMLGVGTYDAFKAALNEAPTVRIIEVDSAGGRIYEAAAIAHLIRKHGLDVTVVGQCLSACTFILIAGQIRAASPLATIGFHRPSLPGLDKRVEASQVQQTKILYRNAGLPKDFITRIYETAEDDMWYPTKNELIQAGVVSGHVSKFTVWEAPDTYRVEKYDGATSSAKPQIRQSDSTGTR